jgi:O-antigen biosynthesis protein
VVSDTGGFRETLALVDRTSAVYWFKPADPQSLSVQLAAAIAQHPETPIVATHSTLERTNQKLLAQKMGFIEQAFAPSPPVSYPKVTIGITCYNLGQYLIECLTSVETQSYRYLEVIIFDDASPDLQTQEDIEKAKSLFPTYKFIRAEQNLGLGGARNQLIEMAEGDYFLPLDADNRLLPFAVEKFVEAAIANQAAIVACPMLCFGIHNGVHHFKLSSVFQLLHMNEVGDACSLFSIEFLKKFKHPERRDCSTQDWCILSAAIATDATVVHLPYPLYEYRQRQNSMIKNASFSKERYYVRQYLAQIPPQDWSPRQLYMLMTGVQQLNAQLAASQAETAAAQAELEQVRQRLRRVRIRKETAEQALEETNAQLNAMTTSKFWKLRKGWFKIKRILRLTKE